MIRAGFLLPATDRLLQTQSTGPKIKKQTPENISGDAVLVCLLYERAYYTQSVMKVNTFLLISAKWFMASFC